MKNLLCFITLKHSMNPLVFFLGKRTWNLEGCLVVLVKIGNNMVLAKKIQRKSFIIFDPKGRTIQMSKKESESENDEMSTRFMDLLEDFNNNMRCLEKNIQNQ